MRAKLYLLLRRLVPEERRSRIKRGRIRMRRRLAPQLRAWHGVFGAADLRAELASRVPDDAEILMVHCSLNDLEPMYVGTARELLDELVELCGPDRTLAMPAFFFGGADHDPAAYYRAKPVFDARRHPSQMGLVSELFRRRRGVRRSLHPTVSVSASGPLADELVRAHHTAGTTFGEDTPFGLMAERRTAVIGLGTEYFRCLTQVHAAEDLLGNDFPVPLRRGRLPVQLCDVDGAIYDYDMQVDDVSRRRRRLELIERLLGADEIVRWRFHGVPLFVLDAGRVTEVLIEAARRGETIYLERPIRVGRGLPIARARRGWSSGGPDRGRRVAP